ncbi:MAG: ribonuclease E/G [Rhodospirillaceae bacterium]|nr:ribonuclease E/G [Rhodospirillaceae bacterium]
MTKRMLIDGTHAEETRVVVADDTVLLEFDFETTTKSQLKGNIYLAKVTRVEPSLQAAFIDFGGNRHGFLAFSEIHPDYYRIPVEDKEALIAKSDVSDEIDEIDIDEFKNEDINDNDESDDNPVEVIGDNAEDDIAELGDAHRKRLRQLTRMYKIQEVIKRRQILLVQVVKEERGNKGAALTTYLSLPGRYCVLMPNTSRGGGISRKISNPAHRKRMKTIMADLVIPEGMAVIMRTAGVERNKAEVRRDYEYLRRSWDQIREQTLQSSAPAIIYEEGDLIKRSLRDVYNREIEEVIVDGEPAYKTARSLMRTMMPSHAKRVKKHTDINTPLFNLHKIESQLDEIYDPIVRLRSGGYIVINPTEALVAIDVNSGRATRERNVEQTARRTNLEAADEVARQLRLRDLAGLVVIDFIDMEESRNITAVERRMKEAMKIDRARIQIGRISILGLLELSRQRLRPSIHEASAQICVRCGGSGYVRSTESTALRVIRAIEEEGAKNRSKSVNVKVPADVALYILNNKRDMIVSIEQRHNLKVLITVDSELTPPDYIMDRLNSNAAIDEIISETIDSRNVEITSKEEEDRTRRRKTPRRIKNDDEQKDAHETNESSKSTDESPETLEQENKDTPRPTTRRRGRRGGRRRRKPDDIPSINNIDTATNDEINTSNETAENIVNSDTESTKDNISNTQSTKAKVTSKDKLGDGDSDSKPKKRRTRRRRTKSSDNDLSKTVKKVKTTDSSSEKLKNSETANIKDQIANDSNDTANKESQADKKVSTEEEVTRPRRSGWWSRTT